MTPQQPSRPNGWLPSKKQEISMMTLSRQVRWRTGLGFMLLVALVGWPLLCGKGATTPAT